MKDKRSAYTCFKTKNIGRYLFKWLRRGGGGIRAEKAKIWKGQYLSARSCRISSESSKNSRISSFSFFRFSAAETRFWPECWKVFDPKKSWVSPSVIVYNFQRKMKFPLLPPKGLPPSAPKFLIPVVADWGAEGESFQRNSFGGKWESRCPPPPPPREIFCLEGRGEDGKLPPKSSAFPSKSENSVLEI